VRPLLSRTVLGHAPRNMRHLSGSRRGMHQPVDAKLLPCPRIMHVEVFDRSGGGGRCQLPWGAIQDDEVGGANSQMRGESEA